MRSVLDQDLTAIRDDILRMSALIDQSIDRAIQAFERHDEALAQAVCNDDTLIDQLHNKIEDHVTRTFALQQPIMAGDLRRLIANLLISNELERMGDHAEGIARTVLRYTGDKPIEIPPHVSKMHEIVRRMLHEVMDAYIPMDPDMARAVAQLDDEVDVLYQELFSKLVGVMGKGKKGRLKAEQGTYLLWTGHNLERIGDRVTNICERIVYAGTGSVYELNPKRDN